MSGGTGEFIGAMLRSETFWSGPALWLAIMFASAAIAFGLIARLGRRMRRRPLHADESGAAGAVDFVLTLPVLWFFTACVVQFAFLANGAILVHYAAYSAARTARVHTFQYDVTFGPITLDAPTPIPCGGFTGFLCRERVDQLAEQSARYALIAAGSADKRFVSTNANPLPQSVLNALTAAAGDQGPAQALMRKAQYAFDANNATVDVSTPTPFGGCSSFSIPGLNLVGPNGCRPVRATVSFRLPVTVPGAQAIADVCNNGYCYKVAEATVEVL